MDRAFGSFLHRVIWRNRHLMKKNWAENYLSTSSHAHRQRLAEFILSDGVESVCELGCGPGANLFYLKKLNPDLRVFGVDLNSSAIKTARAFAKEEGVKWSEFMAADINKCADSFSVSSYDVVVIDAVLMFVTPLEIFDVIRLAMRVAKKKVVLHEYFYKDAIDGYFDGGRWMYDYPAIASSIDPTISFSLHSGCLSGGLWDSHGAVIEIYLS